MNKLAEKVQQALVKAIDNDDLVLPTLPEVALNIRQAAEDPDISISHLSKVISRDTALSARLIKVVNSPLLRATQEVTDLHTVVGQRAAFKIERHTGWQYGCARQGEAA